MDCCSKLKYCMLTNKCCGCGDKRDIKNGYLVYIDGKGDNFTRNRKLHYCSSCRTK